VWVTGSRQFRDFDDYLYLAGADNTVKKNAGKLTLIMPAKVRTT
jgi:hypothetical protein